MPEENYTKICPKCGSTDIIHVPAGKAIFIHKCRHCSYENYIFPEVILSEVEEYRKHLNETLNRPQEKILKVCANCGSTNIGKFYIGCYENGGHFISYCRDCNHTVYYECVESQKSGLIRTIKSKPKAKPRTLNDVMHTTRGMRIFEGAYSLFFGLLMLFTASKDKDMRILLYIAGGFFTIIGALIIGKSNEK